MQCVCISICMYVYIYDDIYTPLCSIYITHTHYRNCPIFLTLDCNPLIQNHQFNFIYLTGEGKTCSFLCSPPVRLVQTCVIAAVAEMVGWQGQDVRGTGLGRGHQLRGGDLKWWSWRQESTHDGHHLVGS